MKKIGKLLKFVIVSVAWSYVYFVVMRWTFLKVWHFDILIADYWLTVADFWNRGGVISKLKDLVFVFALVSLVPLWLYFFIKLLKADVGAVITYPIVLYNRHMVNKYGSATSRIVFRNLGAKKDDMSFEDMVNMKMKQSKNENNETLEADKLRNIVQEKIRNKK